VEQFEIGRNDAGFRCFLTVSRTVATVRFYGATDVSDGGIFTVTVTGGYKAYPGLKPFSWWAYETRG
jgi:hypothetical protein